MVKTFSYISGGSPEDIIIGEQYYFGQLVEGEGDIEQLLEDRCVFIGEDVVEFKIIQNDEDIFKTLVRVTDIY